jgi:type I restriction enzyme S subunit
VRFLDHWNGRLEKAIRSKRRVIALLQEQKQAIIHRAVTRGLDPNVQLKESGIPWLGEIPEHWEVRRLGSAIKLITGYPFKSEGFSQSESSTRLLRGINVTPNGLRWDSTVGWERTSGDGLDGFALEVGDIVLGMDRPIIASGTRASRVEPKDVPSLLLQRVARLRPKVELDGNFLLLLLKGKLFADYMAPIFTGISVPHLSPEQIRSFKVMLPPLSEQADIVKYVAHETSTLTTAIARFEREITLLREYRTRLTADVVTGKLDVRAAAAQLPEEAEEEPLPDPEIPEEETELEEAEA